MLQFHNKMNNQRTFSYIILMVQLYIPSFVHVAHTYPSTIALVSGSPRPTRSVPISSIQWPEHYNRTFNFSFWPSDLETSNSRSTGAIRNECVVDGGDCPYKTNGLLVNMIKQRDVNSRSISPWVWVRDYNPYRYPTTIYQACCVCKHCVNLVRGGYKSGFYSENVTVSLNVGYYNVDTGSIEERTEEFVIGCTCAPARNGM